MPETTSPNALSLLRQHAGEWVNDNDIIAKAGPEAILTLRALRREGQPLRARVHPRGEGLQWMFDGEPPAPPAAQPPLPIERRADGSYGLRELTCYDCGGTYTIPRSTHLGTERHQAWVAAQVDQTQTTVFTEPIRDERAEPLPANVVRLEFGKVRVCRRCRGKLRGERKTATGRTLPADVMCMDPQDPSRPCRACRGTGVEQLAGA